MPADIRTAHADDADALAAVEDAVFSTDRISRRSFQRLIASPSAAVLVAGDATGILGYAVVLFRAGSKTARLYSIASLPGNAGLGRALLAACEAEASRRCATALRLEVRQDNRRAIDLYEKSAYRRIGDVENYYADGMTARRYEKPLARQPGTARHGRAPLGTVPS